jgi:thymidylate synthase (FAD)
MQVKVVAITKPIDEALTVDEFIAYVARVSNPNNQMNKLTAPQLLKFLVKHKHWSPLEMAHVVLEINTTRDIGRQILRHRSFSFQEFSQRYADPRILGATIREARLQDHKNRQNSIITDDEELKEMWAEYQQNVLKVTLDAYAWAMNNGIAKEQARAVLAEGLTNSRMYMAGSLRSWVHYCDLRATHGTQLEHLELAVLAWEAIVQYFPSMSELKIGT